MIAVCDDTGDDGNGNLYGRDVDVRDVGGGDGVSNGVQRFPVTPFSNHQFVLILNFPLTCLYFGNGTHKHTGPNKQKKKLN